jgi:hypothetical protein
MESKHAEDARTINYWEAKGGEPNRPENYTSTVVALAEKAHTRSIMSSPASQQPSAPGG